jgi:hypothetical protein
MALTLTQDDLDAIQALVEAAIAQAVPNRFALLAIDAEGSVTINRDQYPLIEDINEIVEQLASNIDAIKAKTDLITSRNASQQSSPVFSFRVVRGDSLTQSIPVGTNYTGFAGTFTVRHRITNAVLLTMTSVSVASPTALTLALTTSNTAFALLVSPSDFGPHPYDIEMVSGATRKTETGIIVVAQDRTT